MASIVRLGAICGGSYGIGYYAVKYMQDSSGGDEMSRADAPEMKEAGPCRPVIVCGPSGAGKSTLIKMLMKKYPEDFGFSVRHTTRSPRVGEKDGVDYHFTDDETMREMISRREFVEYAQVHTRMYGTSIKAVQDVSNANRVCILDIDVQGVNTVMQAEREEERLKPLYLFIGPPSVDVLEARLRSRATDSEEAIEGRIKTASKELSAAESMPWDRYIVNDNLESSFLEFENFVSRTREACKACRERSAGKSQT